MVRKMAGNGGSQARYHKMTPTSTDGGFVDLQYEKKQSVKVPYKAILLAVGLFVAGSTLIVVGACLLAGVIDTQYSDRTWPVLILGSLMFIPGAYHVRIAYYAYQGYQGYSYTDIPEFD